MRSILGPVKMGHAVNAGERRCATMSAMSIELFLGEDIPTGLSTVSNETK